MIKYISIVSCLLISIIWSIAFAQTACTTDYNPVCGSNWVTYSNVCIATSQSQIIDYAGECTTGTELEQALAFSYQFGITKYNTTEQFKPTQSITREQISKMMIQFAKVVNSSIPQNTTKACGFTDLHITDPTLTNFILQACNEWMIKWRNNEFHPKEYVSHAQALTILMRIMGGIQQEPAQWRSPYETYALREWYISKPLSQPWLPITRGELIQLMHRIYRLKQYDHIIYETRSIKDVRTPCGTRQECLVISRNNWPEEQFTWTIQWFRFVPWYIYTVQLMGNKSNSWYQWTYISTLSLESYNGKPNQLPKEWCDRVLINNDLLSVWWQQCETTTITYDTSLPGIIWRQRSWAVTTSIPLIHIFTHTKSTWLQSLLFETHSSMIKQWLVPKSANCIFQQTWWVIGSNVQRFEFWSPTKETCGSYESWPQTYFIRPTSNWSTMIYLNMNEPYRELIDRSSAIIK